MAVPAEEESDLLMDQARQAARRRASLMPTASSTPAAAASTTTTPTSLRGLANKHLAMDTAKKVHETAMKEQQYSRHPVSRPTLGSASILNRGRGIEAFDEEASTAFDSHFFESSTRQHKRFTDEEEEEEKTVAREEEDGRNHHVQPKRHRRSTLPLSAKKQRAVPRRSPPLLADSGDDEPSITIVDDSSENEGKKKPRASAPHPSETFAHVDHHHIPTAMPLPPAPVIPTQRRSHRQPVLFASEDETPQKKTSPYFAKPPIRSEEEEEEMLQVLPERQKRGRSRAREEPEGPRETHTIEDDEAIKKPFFAKQSDRPKRASSRSKEEPHSDVASVNSSVHSPLPPLPPPPPSMLSRRSPDHDEPAPGVRPLTAAQAMVGDLIAKVNQRNKAKDAKAEEIEDEVEEVNRQGTAPRRPLQSSDKDALTHLRQGRPIMDSAQAQYRAQSRQGGRVVGNHRSGTRRDQPPSRACPAADFTFDVQIDPAWIVDTCPDQMKEAMQSVTCLRVGFRPPESNLIMRLSTQAHSQALFSFSKFTKLAVYSSSSIHLVSSRR